MDARGLAAEALEQVEVRAARTVQHDDLAIHDGVVRQIAKRCGDVEELLVEGLASARE
jgi:hypothetical protein